MASNRDVNLVLRLKDKASNGLKKISDRTGTLNSAWKKWGKTLLKVFAVLSVAITKALVDFAKFESKLVDVTNLFGGSRKEVVEFAKALTDLSTEVPQSAQNLADSLFDIISAGTAAGDAVEFLSVSAKLATAGVTDTKTAVDGLTSVINSFGLSAKDATEVSDKFFEAQKLGKTTIGELSNSIGRIAPLADAVGLSMDEMFAAVSAVTLQLNSTEESVVALRGALTAIISPTSEAKLLAEELGLEFNAAALKAKGFSGFLKDVTEKTGGSNEQISALFGNVRALNGVIALSKKEFAGLDRALGSLAKSSGVTDRAFAKQMDTMSSQATLTKQVFGAFGKDLSLLVSRPITIFLKGLNFTLKEIRKFINDLASSFNSIFNLFSDLLFASLKQLRDAGDGIEKILQGIIKLNLNLIKEGGVDLINLGKKQTGVVSKIFKDFSESLYNTVDETGEVVVDKWEKVGKEFQKATLDIFGSGSESGSFIRDVISNFAPGLGSAISGNFFDIAKEVVGSLFGKKSTVFDFAEESFDRMVKNTNRALLDIGKERTTLEKQVDILEELKTSIGGGATVPREFLDELGLGRTTTVDQALVSLLEGISQTNVEEKLAREKALSQQNTIQNILDEINKQFARGLAGGPDEFFAANRVIRDLLRTQVRLGDETVRIAEIAGIRETKNRFGNKVFELSAQETRKRAADAADASEQRIKELTEELAVRGNVNLDELLDTIALQNRIAELTEQNPSFASSAPINTQTDTSSAISTSSTGGVTINISGNFMGTDAEALEWAKKIDEQLVVLDRTNQRVSA